MFLKFERGSVYTRNFSLIGEDQVRAVTAKNARPDVEYEVADGSQIPNLGEKDFSAITEGGLFRNMNAQVADVNKALLSVSRIVNAAPEWCSTVTAFTSNMKPQASGHH